MEIFEKTVSRFRDAVYVNIEKSGGRFLCVILLLMIAFSFTPEYIFSQNIRAELDSTLGWFRNNPACADGSNFQSRRAKTSLLDKYGWQLSNETWNQYRSCWTNNINRVSEFENENPILYYLRQTIDKAINEIQSTQLTQGVVIWKLYNMGYVIKTKDVCFAIDLVQPGSEKLVNMLDFAIISHKHFDHYDPAFISAMVTAGKTVYSPFFAKGTVIDTTKEFTIKEVNLRFTMNDQGGTPVIASQINCGPGSNNYTIYDIADARILAELNPTRPVNLFILHIANGLNVFDAVDRVKPDATIFDHVMEFGHPIGKSRWSYEFTYNKIQRQSHASSYVLTWGERLDIEVQAH